MENLTLPLDRVRSLRGNSGDHDLEQEGIIDVRESSEPYRQRFFPQISLWPETLAAIKEAIAKRPKPKNTEDEGLVFITKHGRPWGRVTPTKKDKDGNIAPGIALDAIGQKFAKLLGK